MRNANFNEILETAMNTANETNRDKGLLENALTMTAFSMPSQADVIDYEITLLTEKKNQIVGHIEELATEAAERLAEMNAERAAIQSEMEHYKNEYSEALRRQAMARHLYGANSQQVEKHHAAFAFACELYDKAKAQLTGIGVDILELEATLVNIRDFLTGAAPSVTPTSDDLPFESAPAWRNPSAKQISQFEFSKAVNAMLQKSDVLASIESYCQLDAAQLAENLRENSPTYKNHVKSALESAIYDNAQDEQTADALTDAVNVYFDSIVDDVQEALEEFAAPLPPAKSKRIDANFGYCR